MNNFYLFFSLIIVSWHSNAQEIAVWGNDYAQINSYNGILSSNAFTVRLDGNGNLNLPTWRISVRVKQPITNNINQIFPAEKISLLPTTTYGQLNGGMVPTILQIGMPLQSHLQQGMEVFLVPQSQAPLLNAATGGNPYYNFFLLFDLKVEGGSYLSDFTTWTDFIVPLEFKFYDEKNKLKQTVSKNYKLQMATLSGTDPTPTPQFSISIEGNAGIGLLELKTKSDYINGAQVTYQNGLKVSANTDYQINVKSLQPTFLSDRGNTLPLNTIQVSLNPSSAISGSVFPIWLNTNAQKIATGGETKGFPVYYDINYASKPNDINFITSEPDKYYTTLQYEITPK